MSKKKDTTIITNKFKKTKNGLYRLMIASALIYFSRKTYLAILGIRNVGILRVRLVSISLVECCGLEIRPSADFRVTAEMTFSSFLRFLLVILLLLCVVDIGTVAIVAGVTIVLFFETNVFFFKIIPRK
jgi:hypothetical protein